MKVTVKTITGTIIEPIFEPAFGRLEMLMKFYKEKFHAYEIDAYKIVNQFGFVVAQEGEF